MIQIFVMHNFPTGYSWKSNPYGKFTLLQVKLYTHHESEG